MDPAVLAALKVRREHRKIPPAQLEREMWAMEVQPGILAGRLTRSLDRVGCYIPGAWPPIPPAP